jgi:magnesium transporter
MSMIRELRTAVRRNSTAPAVVRAARSRGIVDCAIYRDGVRLLNSNTRTPRLPRDVRRAGHGFVWIGLASRPSRCWPRSASSSDLHPLAIEDGSRLPISGRSWTGTTTCCSPCSRPFGTSSMLS